MEMIMILRVLFDPRIRRAYTNADRRCWRLTKHGLEHAIEVVQTAMLILCGLMMQKDTEEIVALILACLLHDVRRDQPDHARAGSEFARAYLTELGFSPSVIAMVCHMIENHQSEMVKRGGISSWMHAVLVLADKIAGDRSRVRWLRRLQLWILTPLKMAWLVRDLHDRVNYAIVDKRVSIQDGRLTLSVVMDPRVCAPQLLHTLHRERWQACVYACRYLGLAFCLEVNGSGLLSDSAAVEELAAV